MTYRLRTRLCRCFTDATNFPLRRPAVRLPMSSSALVDSLADGRTLDSLAELLLQAAASRRPIEPLTAIVRTLSVDDAYAIQTRVIRRRIGEW